MHCLYQVVRGSGLKKNAKALLLVMGIFFLEASPLKVVECLSIEEELVNCQVQTQQD